MIRHVVLFKMRAGLGPKDAADIVTALKGLKGVIPGIIEVTGGVDVSPEGLQRGNTHALSVDFANAAARDTYLPHPAHQKVGAMIVGASEGGLSGITVLDWEVTG